MMLHSETTGSGEKLIIFVHGNSQSLHEWNAVIGQKVIGTYKKVAVDLPGHGLSGKSKCPAETYTPEGLAAELNEFLEQYKGQPFILVGASLGSVVISVLTPFPPSCVGVFMVGAMLTTETISVKDMVQPNPAVGAAFKGEPMEEEVDAFIDSVMSTSDVKTKREYKKTFLLTDPNMRSYLAQSVGKAGIKDKVESISKTGIPVAVAYGRNDKLVQIDYLDRTPLKKWRDRIHTFADAGHSVELDQPRALAELIGEFAKDCF